MICRPSWDNYGLSLAHMAALRSEDPFCKVGAVALRKDRSLAATGYNGAPPGIALDWTDRDARRPYVCHAEVNCLKYTKPNEVDTLYVTLSPCMACLTVIASYNIKRVVYSRAYDKSLESFEAAKKFGISLEWHSFDLLEHIYKYSKAESRIEEIYRQKISEPSDINEHLATLYRLALECDTIAEFGVRNVVSSYAFANAKPKKLICVDIVKNTQAVDFFLNLCREENVCVEFYEQDSRTFEMSNVDLIFIDTKHNYTQLKEELHQLGNKADKYLVFHDTATFKTQDEIPETFKALKSGLQPAIEEFLEANTNWKIKAIYENCNGLIILENINKHGKV